MDRGLAALHRFWTNMSSIGVVVFGDHEQIEERKHGDNDGHRNAEERPRKPAILSLSHTSSVLNTPRRLSLVTIACNVFCTLPATSMRH
jgi:hypothetical protein